MSTWQRKEPSEYKKRVIHRCEVQNQNHSKLTCTDMVLLKKDMHDLDDSTLYITTLSSLTLLQLVFLEYTWVHPRLSLYYIWEYALWKSEQMWYFHCQHLCNIIIRYVICDACTPNEGVWVPPPPPTLPFPGLISFDACVPLEGHKFFDLVIFWPHWMQLPELCT